MPRFKKVTSNCFYRIFSFMSGVSIESGMADYRLIDREVLQDILRFREVGILFFYLGLLGEYLGRVLIEVRQRPRFLVSERMGLPD